MPIIKIVNATTGEEIEREMNKEEVAQWKKDQEYFELEQAAKREALANKAALLEKLGISLDEAKLLFS